MSALYGHCISSSLLYFGCFAFRLCGLLFGVICVVVFHSMIVGRSDARAYPGLFAFSIFPRTEMF